MIFNYNSWNRQCSNIPSLTTNKWKVGHTLGTSGVLSIEMAIMMLQHQTISVVGL